MTPWQTLFKAIELQLQNRQAAATATWESLTEDFRMRVVGFVTFLVQNPETIDSFKVMEIRSPYGEATFTPQLLAIMKEHVPKFVGV